jgi:hypothetical protein
LSVASLHSHIAAEASLVAAQCLELGNQ